MPPSPSAQTSNDSSPHSVSLSPRMAAIAVASLTLPWLALLAVLLLNPRDQAPAIPAPADPHTRLTAAEREAPATRVGPW